MVDPALYAAYLGVTVLMVVTPGPANLFSIAVGASRGRRAVLAAVLGMNLGTVIWLTAAGLGLAAVALATPGLFRIMALAGGAYLAWIGGRTLLAALRGGASAPHMTRAVGRRAFRDGMMVQVSNPKALLHILVILPPFLDPSRPVGPQLAVLGATGVALDLVVMTAYGFSGAALARRMTADRFQRGFAVASGLLFLVIAALVVTSSWQPQLR